MKVTGAAVGVGVISLGMQNSVTRYVTVDKKYIPGAGGELFDTTTNAGVENVDKIDSDRFVAACSRCGICADECPLKAIKFKSLGYPTLTQLTRNKCPGFDVCGMCFVNCPTGALEDAFKDLDKAPGVEGGPWWEGPTDKAEQKLSGLNK